MRLHLCVAAAMLLSASLVARADTFELFNLNANLANGGTVTGTVDIDQSSTSSYDTFDSSANLTYDLNGVDVAISGNTVELGTGGSAELEFYNLTNLDSFNLAIPTSLATFTGGLCTTAAPCNFTSFLGIDNQATIVDVTGGTLTPAATPEPSSFILLGTGLLGAAGVLRRRLA